MPDVEERSGLTLVGHPRHRVDDPPVAHAHFEHAERLCVLLRLNEEMNPEQVELGLLEVVRGRVLAGEETTGCKVSFEVRHLRLLTPLSWVTHFDHLAQSLENLLGSVALSVYGEPEGEGDPVPSLVRTQLEKGDPVGDVERVVSEMERESRVVSEDLERVLKESRGRKERSASWSVGLRAEAEEKGEVELTGSHLRAWVKHWLALR